MSWNLKKKIVSFKAKMLPIACIIKCMYNDGVKAGSRGEHLFKETSGTSCLLYNMSKYQILLNY